MVIFFANFYLTKIDARGKSIHNFQLLRTTPTISNFYVARIAFTSVRKGTQFDQLELHVPKKKFTTKLFAVQCRGMLSGSDRTLQITTKCGSFS